MSHRRLILVAIALLSLAAPSLAQDVRVYRPTDTVNPEDVARILGAPDARPAIKMRSLRLLDGARPGKPAPAERPATIDGDAAAADVAGPSAATGPSALALPVQFRFDSAEIQPAARRQLDALAAGIRLLPVDKPVTIEGHTDATGTAQYNEQLSHRRAQSVKQYLVATHGIDAARLRVVGMGQRDTLPDLAPQAAENRRVQFRGE